MPGIHFDTFLKYDRFTKDLNAIESSVKRSFNRIKNFAGNAKDAFNEILDNGQTQLFERRAKSMSNVLKKIVNDMKLSGDAVRDVKDRVDKAMEDFANSAEKPKKKFEKLADEFSKIFNDIKNAESPLSDTNFSSAISSLKERIKYEENILEILKEQRKVTEEKKNDTGIKYNSNVDKLNNLQTSLKVKYNGQGEDFYSQKDLDILNDAREKVAAWRNEWGNFNDQVKMYDALIANAEKGTGKMQQAMDKLGGAYKFQDMVSEAEQAQQEVDGLQEKVSQYNKVLASLKDSSGAKRKMIDLGGQIDELNEVIKTTETYLQLQKELEDSVNGLTNSIQGNWDAIEYLENRQKGLSETSEEYINIQKQIDDQFAELTVNEKALAEATKELSDVTSTIDNGKSVKELKGELEDLTGQYEKAKSVADNDLVNQQAIESVQQKISDTNGKLDDARSRLEALKGVLTETKDVYTGFADTVESSSTKIFLSEDVAKRYDELSSRISQLKSEISTLGEGDYVDVTELQALQDELAKNQDEFRGLDDAARHTAEVLGKDLADKVSTSLNSLYRLNGEVRKAQGELDEAEKKLKDAKRELAEATEPKAITEAKAKVDELSVALDEAKDKLSAVKAEQKDALKEVQNISKQMNDVSDSGGGGGSDVVGDLMGKIAAIAGIGVGLSELKGFFDKAREWREYFQDIESSMKVFLGSAEKGAEFTAKLKDYAYYNMFEFSDLAKASQQMISYGQNVDSIIPRLDQLSNVATGTHGSLMELVDAYNRAKATGVVDARGIQAWAVKGVMIKDVLRDMGETVTGTTVSFDQLNKVLDQVTGEGGQFHNLMLEMMDNISAESGQLEDNLASMYEEVGKKFEGVFVKFLKLQSAMAEGRNSFISDDMLDFGAEKANQALDYLLENWQSIISTIKDVVAAYGIYRGALIVNTAMNKAAATWEKIKAGATGASATATAMETAAKEAETVAEGTNSAATTGNTAAKTANLTVTKLLTYANNQLTAAMAKNPYALAIAAVAALAFTIYKAYDAIHTEAEAQRLLNDVTEDYNDKVKEQDQKARDYISTVKNTTASLVEQTAAYKALIKEREAFAKYSQSEIKGMTLEQINTIISQDDLEKNEQRLRNQLEALREIRDEFHGKGAAWIETGEDDTIDEIVKKFGLLPEYAEKLKESIKGMTSLSDWADTQLDAMEKELREHLEKSAQEGISEGFRKGFNDAKTQESATTLIEKYNDEISNNVSFWQDKITEYQRKISELEEANISDSARQLWVGRYNEEIEKLNANIDKANKKTADFYKNSLQKQIDETKKKFDELNREIINATGPKKTEIQAQLNATTEDLNTLNSIMAYFDAGVVNRELIVSVKADMEAGILGDEALIEVGDIYDKVNDFTTQMVTGIDEAAEEMSKFGNLSVEEAEKIAKAHGLTAENIEKNFGDTMEKLNKDIQELTDKLDKETDPSKRRKIQLELDKKREIVRYITEVRTRLDSLVKNPFNLKVKIYGEAVGWLKSLLKAAGFDSGEGGGGGQKTSSGGGKWGNRQNLIEDWGAQSMRRMGFYQETAEYERQAAEAKRRAEEAKARQKKEDEIEKHNRKGWEAKERQEAKEKRDKILKELDAGVDKTRWDELKRQLADVDRILNKGKSASDKKLKEEQTRLLKEIQQIWKHSEEMVKLGREAERAYENAKIASIRQSGQRERAEREAQHRRTIEDLKNQEQEVYKKIYQDRKAAYENANKGEKTVPYELTEKGKDGWEEIKRKIEIDPNPALDAIRQIQQNLDSVNPSQLDELFEKIEDINISSLSDKENEHVKLFFKKQVSEAAQKNAEMFRYEEDRVNRQLQSMRDYLKEYGTFQQKKLAIAEEYAKKIEDAETEGEKLRLKKEQEKKEANVEYEAIEQKIDWNSVFDNLGLAMKGSLEEMLNDLKKFVQTPKFQQLDAQQKQSIVNSMSKIRGTIGTTEDLGFHDLAIAVKEYQEALQKQREAQQNYDATWAANADALKKAKEKLDDLQKNDPKNKTAIKDAEDDVKKLQGVINDSGEELTKANDNVKASGHNMATVAKDVTKPVSEITTFLKASGIPALGELFGAFDELKGGIDGLKALKELKDLDGKEIAEAGKDLAKDVGQVGKDVAEGTKEATDALAEGLGKAGLIAQIIAAILKILDVLKDGIGPLISGIIDSILNAINGILDNILSGQFIEQIVTSIVKGIGQILNTVTRALGNVLTLGALDGGLLDWLGLGSPDNSEYEKTLEKWGNILDVWRDTIDYQRELMEKAYGAEAIAVQGKSIEQLSKVIQAAKDQFLGWMGSGAGTFRHSYGHDINESANWRYLAQTDPEMLKWLGGSVWQDESGKWHDEEVGDIRKLMEMDWEDLERFKNDNAQFWATIHEDVRGYLETYIEAGKEMDEVTNQLNEKLTTTTKENVIDEFTDSLYEYANAMSDITKSSEEDWQKMANKMVISNDKVIGEMRTELGQWYKDLAELQNEYTKEGSTMTEDEYYRRLQALNDKREQIIIRGQERVDELREDGIIKAIEDETTSFGNLKELFSETLTDMEFKAEDFRKKLNQTLVQDLLEKQVFDVKLTVNGQDFENFDAYSKDWNRRYAEALKANDEEMLNALIDELVEQQGILNEAAKDIRERLKETQEDTTFKDMSDSWVSTLMDMSQTAEDWAQNIGRTMAQKIIEEMIVPTMMQPLLDQLQDVFNTAMKGAVTEDENGNKTYDWSAVIGDGGVSAALQAIKDAYPELSDTVKSIMEALGVSIEDGTKQGFSDLKGTILNSLMDVEGDIEKFGKELGKSMMEQMMQSMVENKYGDQLKELNDEWAEAVKQGDPTRIEAVRQKIIALYETIGDDEALRQLLDDIREIAEEETPFDGLRSSFLSTITDMKENFDDFVKDLKKQLAEALVNEVVLGKDFNDRLDYYKKEYKKIMSDPELSAEERAKALRALADTWTDYAAQKEKEADELYKLFGIYENEDQQATMNMANAATYDQFELYLGMATSHLMVAEQTKGLVQEIRDTLSAMNGVTSGTNYQEQIFMRLGTTNEYVLAIKRAAEGMREEFGRKMDLMNSQLQKL